jgi:hypothetical protein
VAFPWLALATKLNSFFLSDWFDFVHPLSKTVSKVIQKAGNREILLALQ